MMKVDKTYNVPEILTLNTKGAVEIAKGSTVNPADLADANNYFLTDSNNNILTNSEAFSDVTAANGTFGSLSADTLAAASLTTQQVNFGNNFEISATDTPTLTISKDGKNVFSVDSTGNATVTGSLTTGGSDIASVYGSTDDTLTAGDVVSLDSQNKNGVVKATTGYDNTLLGVMSTHPGVNLTDTVNGTPVSVAFSGKATVKVTDANGAIHAGDYLTSSTTPGVAMKATTAGQVLGRALEDFNSGTGTIMAVINVSYADPLSNQQLSDANGNTSTTTVSTTAVTLPSSIQIGSTEVSGTLADALVAISDTIATHEATISVLQTNVLQVATQEGQLADQVNTIAQTTASNTAVLATTNDKLASTSAGLASLQEQINNLFATSSSTSSFVASSPADLGLDTNLGFGDATVSGTLNVLGRTTLQDVGITGNINAGVLSIHGLNDDGTASINTLSGDLKVQDAGVGGLDILSGKVVISKDGNVTVAQTLGAQTVNTQKLNIVTTDNSASTSAQLTASAGEDTMTAGQKSLVIHTKAVTSKSLIYVTFTGDYSPAIRYWTDSKVAGTSFTVHVDAPVANDAQFNWWIVN
jgi:hypothetical protein